MEGDRLRARIGLARLFEDLSVPHPLAQFR